MDSPDADGPALSARAAAELEYRVLQQLDEAVGRVRQVQHRLEQSEESFRRMLQDQGGLLHGILTVEQLVEVNKRLGRLVDDSAHRMDQFEQRVNREWSELREQYREPLQAFRELALELRQASVEAARSAALSRQLAESAFAAMAARATRPANDVAPAPAPIEPWSLDEVTRVHQEVRAAQQSSGPPRQPADESTRAARPESRPGPLLSLPETDRDRRTRRIIAWAAAAAVIVLIPGAFGMSYLSQVRERLGAVDARMEAADARLADAERRTTRAREQAEQQIREAQQMAQRAQAVADIIAAPDLRRIDLIGRPLAPGAYAQALLSRTRGFLLNASRMPTAPPGKNYHVWALSPGNAATSLGAFGADKDGRGSVLVDHALAMPRISAIVVSLEDAGQTSQSSGAIVLGPLPRPEQPTK